LSAAIVPRGGGGGAVTVELVPGRIPGGAVVFVGVAVAPGMGFSFLLNVRPVY
jgi:hypothetical protein